MEARASHNHCRYWLWMAWTACAGSESLSLCTTRDAGMPPTLLCEVSMFEPGLMWASLGRNETACRCTMGPVMGCLCVPSSRPSGPAWTKISASLHPLQSLQLLPVSRQLMVAVRHCHTCVCLAALQLAGLIQRAELRCPPAHRQCSW